MEKRFSIGVMTDSFKKPFFEALDKAVEVGAQGIQLYVVDGEMKYDTFDDAKVARVRALLEQYGLVISAVCGDFGDFKLGFRRLTLVFFRLDNLDIEQSSNKKSKAQKGN